MLLVSESPPLRLAVSVSAPDGQRARWGMDDPDASRVPTALSISSTMPGGFEQASCVLERDPRLSYPDLQEFSTLTVHGAGGLVAWQGRLEQQPTTAGYESQIAPQAVGWQAHLDDDSSALEIYVGRDLTQWQGPSLDRQIFDVGVGLSPGSPSTAVDPASNAPAVLLTATAPWSGSGDPIVDAFFDASGIPLGYLYYTWDASASIDLADPNWDIAVALGSDDSFDAPSSDVSANLIAAGPASGVLAATTATRIYALLTMLYPADNASSDSGLQYTAYFSDLALIGRHGLNVHGGVGVLASDVMAHAVGTWAPKLSFTTGPSGTIRPSSFVIDHLVFTTPGTAGTIVKGAAAFELPDWAVWEGPTFYSAAPGTFGKSWRARVGPANLQETGPSSARLFNGVITSYTDVTGVARTAGPPGSGCETTDASLQDLDPANPINEAGLRRWTTLAMQTSTAAGAVATGAAFLANQALLDTSGQATIIGSLPDDRGVLWPAWYIRAGDTMSFLDAQDPSPRRVISASYDDQTKTATISLDAPPQSLQALLERLQVAVIPLGF